MSFDRRLDLVIDDCYTRKNNDRARRLMRYAKLRYPNADIHSIYYDGRGLNKEQILLLSTMICALTIFLGIFILRNLGLI